MLWAAVHGAVDLALALAGHGKPEYGTADPRQLVAMAVAFVGRG